MYYPKSQIKTNLYTNGGELVKSSDQSPYTGYYFQTSKGEFYSGKTPQDTPNFRLIKVSSLPESQSPSEENYYVINSEYYNSKGLPINRTAPSPPKQYYPIPTESNYTLGEFDRYFLKKGNEIKFIEISELDYQKYVSRDSSVLYQLYIPIKINWLLTGNKNQVYQVNRNIVAKAERENRYIGFTEYFKGRFDQFYK